VPRLPKVVWFILGFVLLVMLLVAFFRPSSVTDETRPISTLISDAKSGRVSELKVRGNRIHVTRTDLTTYETRKEDGVSIFDLNANDVNPSSVSIEVQKADLSGGWAVLGLLLQFLPLLSFAGIGYICYQWGKARGKVSQRGPSSGP
jgi:ATP-dependent Zn protease